MSVVAAVTILAVVLVGYAVAMWAIIKTTPPREDRCPTCRSQDHSVLRGVCFIRDSTPQSEPDPWHSAPKEGPE